jgi:hypothetical protein
MVELLCQHGGLVLWVIRRDCRSDLAYVELAVQALLGQVVRAALQTVPGLQDLRRRFHQGRAPCEPPVPMLQ